MNNQGITKNLEENMTGILTKMNEISKKKYIIITSENSKITKKCTEAMNSAKQSIRQYEKEIKLIDERIEELDSNKTSKDYNVYRDYLGVLEELLKTYRNIYAASEERREYIREQTNVIEKSLNNELDLLSELSTKVLKSDSKQYKCLMSCYNSIIRLLEKIKYDFQERQCKYCSQLESFKTIGERVYLCKKYDIELKIGKGNIIKTEKCKL